MLEYQFTATGFHGHISCDFSGGNIAALSVKIGLKSLRYANRVTTVHFRVTKTPELFGFRTTRANRDNVAILANGDRSGGKIFLFFGFVPEIDFAVCLDDDFVIGTGHDVDCSKINVDNKFPAGRRILLLVDFLFGSGRSNKSENEE